MSVQNARPITDRNEKEKKFTDLADKHDLDKRYAKNCRNSFLIVYFYGYRQGDSQALANLERRRAVATVKKSDLDCLMNLMVKIKLIERHGGDAGAERRWLRYQIVESCQANCCTRDELMDQVRDVYDMRYPDGIPSNR